MAGGVDYFRFRAAVLLVTLLCGTTAYGASGDNAANKPFLLSSISNSRPWVGEETMLTYRLYFKDIAPKISNETNPSFQGIWARESVAERYIKSIPVTVHGEPFRSAVLKQFRVAPVQSGPIRISGYSMLCSLPQEPLLNSEKKPAENRIQLRAPDISISARALPEPLPDGFSGAVGTFQLELFADKSTLQAGEPLKLALVLSGTGNLFTLKLPALHLPESFRQTPPDVTTILNKESVETAGSKTLTVTSWPQSPGSFTIPAIRTVVFNPKTAQFITLHSNPVTLSVTKTAEGSGSPSEPLTPRSSDSEYTGTHAERWIIVAAILLLLAAAGFVILRKKQIKRQKSGAGVPHGESGTDISQSAANVKQQLFALLREKGIKSPGGLTRKELNSALRENGITKEVIAEVTELLEALDRVLYAPSSNKANPLPESVAAKAERLLQRIKTFDGTPRK
ncbi:MAG: protein BatD [Chlorobiaceae bacterium]|nr:protein BatD [Chlorobiaceae bacterium]